MKSSGWIVLMMIVAAGCYGSHEGGMPPIAVDAGPADDAPVEADAGGDDAASDGGTRPDSSSVWGTYLGESTTVMRGMEEWTRDTHLALEPDSSGRPVVRYKVHGPNGPTAIAFFIDWAPDRCDGDVQCFVTAGPRVDLRDSDYERIVAEVRVDGDRMVAALTMRDADGRRLSSEFEGVWGRR